MNVKNVGLESFTVDSIIYTNLKTLPNERTNQIPIVWLYLQSGIIVK